MEWVKLSTPCYGFVIDYIGSLAPGSHTLLSTPCYGFPATLFIVVLVVWCCSFNSMLWIPRMLDPKSVERESFQLHVMDSLWLS